MKWLKASLLKNRDTRPLDLLDSSLLRSSSALKQERLATCHECENFKERFKKCSVCGCIMPLKVSLVDSKCPEGRWKE